MIKKNIRELLIAARALIVKNNKLLLVSNDNKIWYTPGGRLKPNESMIKCIEREVFEEIGLNVTADRLAYVYEFLDNKENEHKVECYFITNIVKGSRLPDKYVDLDGPVINCKYMTLSEIKNNHNVFPRFLSNGEWLNIANNTIYKGTNNIFQND